MYNETIPFNEHNFDQIETKYRMMSLETRRYELDLIFLYICNYRTNYAHNDTLYCICSEGNQISNKLNFFEESIVKLQTNLRSLLY